MTGVAAGCPIRSAGAANASSVSGPKNCKLYKMGKPRAVPYKDCGNSYDEGWLDEICTERRDDEE